MNSPLKAYFPMIREKDEILAEIRNKKQLTQLFDSWTEDQQKEFLNFCTGIKGIKILYDAFFKEIMNPETAPELLEEFLSLLLKKQVRIFCVLPNDSTRIADENSLLITDIVVEMEDGSLANVEVQKIGYLFPGERSACYSADLLLRQYKRVRSEKKKKFSYKDIKTVYTIVLFEKSPKEFHHFPKNYLHYFEPRSDTGLELELLQKYLFIPLDIFRKNKQNKHMADKLNAWLTFFSTDSPEEIIQLITAYPEFKSLYEKAYDICRNMERVMGIFSEELRELDRNTVQYMIDLMQEELDQKKVLLEQIKQELEQRNTELEQQSTKLEQQSTQLQQQNTKLEQQSTKLEQQSTKLEQQSTQLQQQNTKLEQQSTKLEQQNLQLEQQSAQLQQQTTQLQQQSAQLQQQTTQLQQQSAQLQQQTTQLQQQSAQLQQQTTQLQQQSEIITQQKMQLEKERHLQKAALVQQIQKMISKGFSANECTEMLAADTALIRQIYEQILNHPDWDHEHILEHLI